MKKFKRIIATVIAMMMILALSAPAVYAAWNRYQELAHINADNYREMGFAETSGAIVMNGDIWRWAGNQGTLDGSYYYSAQNNTTYYMNGNYYSGQTGGNNARGSTINLPGASGYLADDGNFVFNGGLTYTDGYYTYFWSNSQSRYFRYTNENGGKQYDGPKTRYPTTYSGSGKTDQTTAYSEKSANLSGYNYSYKGVKLYAGKLYNVEQYVDKNQAKRLADFIHDYAGALSYGDKINTGWMGVNYSQTASFDTTAAHASYPRYDPNLDYTADDYNAACEVLFRLAAENSSMSYVGRTLPKGYTYYTINGDGQIFFKDFAGGAYYTFPDAEKSSQYHTPY